MSLSRRIRVGVGESRVEQHSKVRWIGDLSLSRSVAGQDMVLMLGRARCFRSRPKKNSNPLRSGEEDRPLEHGYLQLQRVVCAVYLRECTYGAQRGVMSII